MMMLALIMAMVPTTHSTDAEHPGAKTCLTIEKPVFGSLRLAKPETVCVTPTELVLYERMRDIQITKNHQSFKSQH